MFCNKNEATVHLTQMLEGKIKKVDLCEDCAKSKGVDDPAGFSLADLLMGLGAAEEMAQGAVSTDTTCPACGFKQADFKKSGRLGCAECYSTFSDGISGLLKNMHKGTRHTGKVPRALKEGHDLQQRLQQLQQKLNDAVTAENYEEAAVIRDEIRALKPSKTVASDG
jgi:protein arginine kinase activator